MSAEIIGYKANRNLTDNEEIEFNYLKEITKYLSGDIVGKRLLDRFVELSKKLGNVDVGMFYCPYIPLMKSGKPFIEGDY